MTQASSSQASSSQALARGRALAQTKGDSIKAIVGNKYLVPSASGAAGYVVDVVENSCTCPDWMTRGGEGRAYRCKHIFATLHVRREIPLSDGSFVVTEEKKIKIPRNWRAINLARTLVPARGPTFLSDLIGGLPLPPAASGRGRPRIPTRDMVLTAALRSLWNCTAAEACEEAKKHRSLGLIEIERVPSYNSLLREAKVPTLMPIFQRLLAASALPLIRLDNKFGIYTIDGTGFSTSRYGCHNEEKPGSEAQRRRLEEAQRREEEGAPDAEEKTEPPKRRQKWVEAKIVFGASTHVIAAVQVTDRYAPECPLMPVLLQRAIENGAIVSEFLADAAYWSAYNIEAVQNVGAKPYIDFPSSVGRMKKPAIRNLHGQFLMNEVEWKEKYAQRNQAESGMHMLKTRFSHCVRSRTPSAMYAEMMLRCVAHNVAVLIQAIEEFGICGEYWMAPNSASPLWLPLAAEAPQEVPR